MISSYYKEIELYHSLFRIYSTFALSKMKSCYIKKSFFPSLKYSSIFFFVFLLMFIS